MITYAKVGFLNMEWDDIRHQNKNDELLLVQPNESEQINIQLLVRIVSFPLPKSIFESMFHHRNWPVTTNRTKCDSKFTFIKLKIWKVRANQIPIFFIKLEFDEVTHNITYNAS